MSPASPSDRPAHTGPAAGRLPAGPDATAASSPARRFHISGLDALRAIAVLAVVIYHVDPGLLPGGFIGVDVFFVVSGFLITTLLLRERARTGRIDLRGFWIRRARRLLPALLVVITVCSAAALLGGPDLRVHLDRQVLGALTFSTNWLELAAGGSYFHHTAPVLFMNFWSLAVEEQFYLVWPLLFLGIMAVTRRPAPRILLALAGAVASAALMAGLYVPGEDPTRVYYGTDTHAFGLLLGIALAFAWQLGRGPAAGLLARRGPASALLGVGTLVVGACFAVLTEDGAATYRAGLALASLGTLAMIASQLGPTPALGRVLEARPLVWVGRRSYGIYLWHWPVLKILNDLAPTGTRTPAWWAVQAGAVVLTVVLAAVSERWIEQPVRRRGFRAVLLGAATVLSTGLSAVGSAETRRRMTPRLRAALAGGLVGVLLFGTAAVAVVTAPQRSQVEQDVDAAQQAMAESQQKARERAKERAEQRASAAPSATASPGALSASPTPKGSQCASPKPEDMTFIGDSLIAVSAPGLMQQFPGAVIDGVPNRKWDEAEGLVRSHLGDGTLGPCVVLDFGTNGGIPEPGVLDRVLDMIGPDRDVVLVTIYGQSTFIEAANQLLWDQAKKRPNVRIADWYAIASTRPDLLQSDLTHPNIPGGTVFAETIERAFQGFGKR